MKTKKMFIIVGIILSIIIVLLLGHFYRAIRNKGFHELYVLGKSTDEIIEQYGDPNYRQPKFTKDGAIKGYTLIYEFKPRFQIIFYDNEYFCIYCEDGIATKVEIQSTLKGG